MATARKPTKKIAAPKTKPRPKEIEVAVDAGLKKTWTRFAAVLASSSIEGARAWDRKYEAVGEILRHEPPLYLAGGVSTAGAFIAKYLPGEDVRSVMRNVRVAQYASPDEEARYGTSKLDAGIEYLEAKHGKPRTGRIPVDFEKLRLDMQKGSIAFATASVKDVRTAARLAVRTSDDRPAPRRSPVVTALTKRLPRGATGVTIHYASGHVSIGNVPLRELATVLRALAEADLPLDPT